MRWLRTFGLPVLAAAALLFLGGCSKEPVDGPGNASGKVALDFSVEGIGEMFSATKAALTSNTTVRVIAYSSNASNPATANYVADQAYYWNGSKLVPCTVDANGNKTADAADQVMTLLPDKNYDFYAVSPALPLATDKRTLSTAVNNGVDYAVSDKTTTTVPSQTTPYALTLNTLQRQFAQVKFSVTSEGLASVTSLEVAGLADAVSGVTVGDTLTAASSGTQSLSLTGSDFTVSNKTATVTTTVLPLNNVDLSLTVTLTVGGLQSEVSGEIKRVKLESGKSYTITMTISNETSEISFSVTESWTTNSGNNATLGGGYPGYPYVIDGKYIVSLDAFGGLSGIPIHSLRTSIPIHNEERIDGNASGYNTVGAVIELADSWAGKDLLFREIDGKCRTPWRVPTGNELRVIELAMNKGAKITVEGQSLRSVWIYGSTVVPPTALDGSTKAALLSKGTLEEYIVKYSSGVESALRVYVLCVRDRELGLR